MLSASDLKHFLWKLMISSQLIRKEPSLAGEFSKLSVVNIPLLLFVDSTRNIHFHFPGFYSRVSRSILFPEILADYNQYTQDKDKSCRKDFLSTQEVMSACKSLLCSQRCFPYVSEDILISIWPEIIFQSLIQDISSTDKCQK